MTEKQKELEKAHKELEEMQDTIYNSKNIEKILTKTNLTGKEESKNIDYKKGIYFDGFTIEETQINLKLLYKLSIKENYLIYINILMITMIAILSEQYLIKRLIVIIAIIMIIMFLSLAIINLIKIRMIQMPNCDFKILKTDKKILIIYRKSKIQLEKDIVIKDNEPIIIVTGNLQDFSIKKKDLIYRIKIKKAKIYNNFNKQNTTIKNYKINIGTLKLELLDKYLL